MARFTLSERRVSWRGAAFEGGDTGSLLYSGFGCHECAAKADVELRGDCRCGGVGREGQGILLGSSIVCRAVKTTVGVDREGDAGNDLFL